MTSYFKLTSLATTEQKEIFARLFEKITSIKAWSSVHNLSDESWKREQMRVNEDERDARILALFERAIEHYNNKLEEKKIEELNNALKFVIEKKMPRCPHSYTSGGELDNIRKISTLVYTNRGPYTHRQINEIKVIDENFKKNWGKIHIPACESCCNSDEKILKKALLSFIKDPHLITEKMKEEALNIYRNNIETKRLEYLAKCKEQFIVAQEEKKKKLEEQNAIAKEIKLIMEKGWQ